MSTDIHLEHLAVGYRPPATLRGIDVHLEAGSLVAILGPNGSGKSTLVKTLLGLLPPLAGRIHGLATHGVRTAYLAQQSDIDRSFPITVLETVVMGLWPRLGHVGRVTADHLRQAREALGRVGMAHTEQRTIAELSAGQFQRILFARTMLQDAALIIMDEPFNAVDESTVQDLMAYIHQWHQEGRTVLVVLHDLGLALEAFPLTLLAGGGRVRYGATAEVLCRRNMVDAGYWGSSSHALERLFNEPDTARAL